MVKKGDKINQNQQFALTLVILQNFSVNVKEICLWI